MSNNIEFVNFIIKRLEASGIGSIVFGGWAEELAGVIKPRPHKDLDLLYVGSDFSQVDKFMGSHTDIVEIKPKHFPHKRAFLHNEIMVELLLLQSYGNGFLTMFWDEYKLEWPEFSPLVVHLANHNPIAITPPAIVNFYRQAYPQIHIVRQKHTGP